MPSTYNLGKVVGNPGLVNGVNNLGLDAGDNSGINYTDSNGNISITMDTNVVQTKLTGNPNQVLGFDANGNAVPVPAGYELYGFELQMDESEPSNMVRYIAQNIGYKSAHMDYTTGQFDYGDWENAFFIKNIRPCMLNYDGTVAYDLDKNDYTKKVDGSASDISNDSFGGNAMVGIPTVWIKVDTRNTRKPKFYFANRPLDGSYKAYAHHDSNGNVMPYTYLPIYNGWVDSSDRLRSISGKTPTGGQTGAIQITEARANGAAWDIEKFCDRQLINLLLVLISKTTDSQTAFGNGNMNGVYNPAPGSDVSGVLPTGTMNINGLFYGSTAENLGVKVFGMEHYWGNLWRRHMGLVLSSGTLYYKLTHGTEDGSTVQGFDPTSIGDSAGTPTGWINNGAISGGSLQSDYYDGYIGDMYAGEYGLMPKSLSGGSSSSKYCDYGIYRTTQNHVAFYGGNSGNGLVCGAFACYLGYGLSIWAWDISAAISCKPNI